MRSTRLYAPHDLRLADEPPPPVGEGETLVRVTDVGVCGSDLHWFAEGCICDARLTRPIPCSSAKRPRSRAAAAATVTTARSTRAAFRPRRRVLRETRRIAREPA